MLPQPHLNDTEADDDECVICLETIVFAEAEGVRAFDCSHRVHGWCAKSLVTSEHGSRCPCCRAPAIFGNLGVSQKYRTEPSHPVALGDLKVEDRVMFIANAFAREGADSIQLVDLVESINSFLLHEGMEVCTKLALLSELYNMNDSALVADNAFLEIRIPSTRVVFLDSESLQTVLEWEQRRKDAEAKERHRVESIKARESEEDRLSREHQAHLDNQIATLRAAALARERKQVESLEWPVFTPPKKQNTVSKAPRQKLDPAKAFSLLCKKVGATPRVQREQDVRKRALASDPASPKGQATASKPDKNLESTASSGAATSLRARSHMCQTGQVLKKQRSSGTTLGKISLSSASKTRLNCGEVEYELEVVSEPESATERLSDSSSSSSSSSSYSSSDSEEDTSQRMDVKCLSGSGSRILSRGQSGAVGQRKADTTMRTMSSPSVSKAKCSDSSIDVAFSNKENQPAANGRPVSSSEVQSSDSICETVTKRPLHKTKASIALEPTPGVLLQSGQRPLPKLAFSSNLRKQHCNVAVDLDP